MAGALAKLSRIRTALESAKSLDDIVSVRDQSAAVISYAKAIGLSIENVNAAVEIKLLAERKAGELLAGMALRSAHKKNLRNSSQGHDGPPIKLDDIGVTNHQSKRWQKLATIPETTFSEFVRSTNESKVELTTAAVMRHWAGLSKPSNGKKSDDSIAGALEHLHKSVAKIYASWPRKSRHVLAAKLRAYAEELEANGELSL